MTGQSLPNNSRSGPKLPNACLRYGASSAGFQNFRAHYGGQLARLETSRTGAVSKASVWQLRSGTTVIRERLASHDSGDELPAVGGDRPNTRPILERARAGSTLPNQRGKDLSCLTCIRKRRSSPVALPESAQRWQRLLSSPELPFGSPIATKPMAKPLLNASA